MNRETIFTIPMNEKDLSEILGGHVITTREDVEFRAQPARDRADTVKASVFWEPSNEDNAIHCR